MFAVAQRMSDFLHGLALEMLVCDLALVILHESLDKLQDYFRLDSIQVVKRLKDLQFLVSGCHKLVVDDNANNVKSLLIVNLLRNR